MKLKLSTPLKVSLIATFLLLSSLVIFTTYAQVPSALLDPGLIPKYVNQLTGPPPIFEPIVQTDPNTGLTTHYPSLDPYPSLPPATKQRTLVLWEVMGMRGPLKILLNGQKWAGDTSEQPVVGTTEEWVIVNTTADTHPIHLHLVQFQLVSRQKIDTKKYVADWIALNNGMMPPFPLNYILMELLIAPYLKGKPTPAPPNEQGWKDTIQMNPGEVTIIRVRFASQDGSQYPFDATQGPGYVWHCHILDYEDNEMMRPYKVKLTR